jgi:translation initiation factor IF-2
MNDIEQITIKTFDIIYKLTEWLEVEREARRPRKEVDTILGQAKILKVFSSTKSGCVAGGNVVYGTLSKRESFKLLRAGVEITRGTVEELQSAKSPVSSIDQGKEFGMQLSCREEILPGDIIETFKVEIK